MGRDACIRAAGLVPAVREEVFAYLADLENHWELAGRHIEVVALDRGEDGAGPAHGGRVRLRGPLGVTRTADTRVEAADPPAGMRGTARLGPITRATVRWSLEPGNSGGTCVTLSASVESTAPLDRALLALGGRAWLRRLFAGAVARLAARFAQEDSALSPGPACLVTTPQSAPAPRPRAGPGGRSRARRA